MIIRIRIGLNFNLKRDKDRDRDYDEDCVEDWREQGAEWELRFEIS